MHLKLILKHLFLPAAILFLCGSIRLQAAAVENFRVNLDYAVFFNKTSGPYIEIYYGLNRAALKGEEKETEGGGCLVAITITKAGEVYLNDMWKMQTNPADTTKNSQIVDVVRYPMEPGKYKLTLHVRDVNDATKKDSIATEVEIFNYSEEKLSLSGIEFASNIQKSKPGGQENFVKNRLEVIPNPGKLYGEGREVLFYYLEAYNLLAGIEGEKYQTLCWITDDQDNKTTGLPELKRTKRKKNNTSVEVGTVNISSLSSGVYYLNFAISELEGEPLITRQKKIYIYNSTQLAAGNTATNLTEELLQSEYASMDSKHLDQEYEYMVYLINDEGQKLYESLDNVVGKRQFIFRFWKGNDPTPGTPVNEYRDTYFKRIKYANEHFRRLGKDGWKTDRGRVMMIYGEPDFIDQIPSSAETKPYEVWAFDSLEGGVEFVFVDASGIREYVLVHSNALGEIRNEDWLRTRARILR